jgi:hypothetical protein
MVLGLSYFIIIFELLYFLGITVLTPDCRFSAIYFRLHCNISPVYLMLLSPRIDYQMLTVGCIMHINSILYIICRNLL